MNGQRWLAAFVGVVAAFLLIEGGWAVWAIDAVRHLEVVPGSPFTTAEDVAMAKSYLPVMYVVATEGFLFGVIALVGAAGILAGQAWARRMLLIASAFLVVTAAVVIGMAPHKWDTQGLFILFCALLWWESRRWPRSSASAL